MNKPNDTASVRLTTFSHGGGCGCKIAPSLLSQIMAETGLGQRFPDLLVGTESSDDAAVYRINGEQAIVATTDFFMPIVDDPFDFGRIAATNAISDVYAMGARPLLALAIVGVPVDKLPVVAIRRILAGGESVCREAGIPIAGGHSIDAPEPIYGLVAIGLVHPDRVKRNDRAQAGDALVLGKPLGVGILSAALKKGELDAAGYSQMLETTTRLNTAGADLAAFEGVHAMTDVTGFGLLGHLLEICRGSRLAAEINFDHVPVLPAALEAVHRGHATGASARNWASYGGEVILPAGFEDWQRAVLTDPQTSGGLLVACAAEAVGPALGVFQRHGFGEVAVIGTVAEGHAQVSVR